MEKKAYKEIIRSTVFSDKMDHIVSINGDLQVAIALIHIRKMDAYIYGMGTNVYWFVKVLKNHGIEIKNIIDIDQEKCGLEVMGVKVITPTMFTETLSEPENAFVFIYTSYFHGMSQSAIIHTLYSVGGLQFYAITSDERRYISMDTVTWMDADRIVFYREHFEEISDFIDILSDVRSLEILNEYLRTYSEGCAWSLPETPDEYKYFYGEKKENELESLYVHIAEEVWVNCGAYIGDTIFNYFKCGLDAKKIYAFEGDMTNFMYLRDNIQRLPNKMADKIVTLREFITSDTNWKGYLGNDKVTLLNADIEGNELALLKATADLIKKDRPVLAICLYHRKEDIVEIPSYINQLVDDYNFYLRKYPSTISNIRRNHETVLYAVPKERAVK